MRLQRCPDKPRRFSLSGVGAILATIVMFTSCRKEAPYPSPQPTGEAVMLTDEERSRLAEIETTNARLAAEVQLMQREKEDLDAKLKELTGQLGSAGAANEDLQIEVEGLRSKQKELESSLVAKELDIIRSRQEKEAIEGELADARSEAAELRKLVGDLTDEVLQGLVIHSKLLFMDLGDCSTTLQELSDSIGVVMVDEATIVEVRTALEEEQKLVDDLQEQVDDSRKPLVVGAGVSADSLRASAAEAYQMLLTARREILTMGTRLQGLFGTEAPANVILMRRLIERLRGQLVETSAQLADQIAVVAGKDAVITQLNRDIERLTAVVAQKDETIAELKHRFSHDIQELEKIISEKEAELETYIANLRQVEEELAGARLAAEATVDRIGLLEKEVGSLKEQKKVVEGRIAQYRQDVGYFASRVVDLERKLASKEKDFSSVALRDVPYNSCREWCEDRGGVVDDVSRQTVRALLDQVGTSDCAVAERRVRRVYNLSLNYMGIRDLRPLKYFTSLRYLSLIGNQIADLTPLANLRLKELIASDNLIEDLTPLTSFVAPSEIRILMLAHNGIADVSPISRFDRLRELWLTNNRLTDVAPLQAISGLERLYLSQNQIATVEALGGLQALQVVGLSLNPLQSVSPLKNISSLRIVWAKGTQISADERICPVKWACHF